MVACSLVAPVQAAPIIEPRVGHRDLVFAVAISDDGKTVASAGAGGLVKVWDVATGRNFQSLQVGSNELRSLVFSADNKLLAAGDSAGGIFIWNTASGELIASLTTDGDAINALAFSHDRNLLAASVNKKIKVFEWKCKQVLHSVDLGEARIGKLGFTGDDKVFLAASDDNVIWAWKIENGVEIKSGELSKLACVDSFLGMSARLQQVVGPGYSSISWNKGRDLQTSIDSKILIGCFTLSKNGKVLVTASRDCIIRLWNVDTRQQCQSFSGYAVSLDSLVFTPDGKRIVVACTDSIRLLEKHPENRLIVLTDQYKDRNYQPDLYSNYGHSASKFEPAERRLAVSSDGKIIAYKNSAAYITVASFESDKVLGFLETFPDVRSIKISPDMQSIAVWSAANIWSNASVVELFSFKDKLLNRLRISDLRASMAFNADGSQLAIGLLKNAIYDIASGKEVKSNVFPEVAARTIAYSPDGKFLAWSSAEGTVGVIDAKSYKEIHQFKRKFQLDASLAFSPDSRLLAIGEKVTGLSIWPVGSRQEPHIVLAAGRKSSPVYSLAFTPDGKFLATGDNANTVRFWDLSRNKMVAKLFMLDGNQWAVVDSAGHFDCSASGRMGLYTKLKNRYVVLGQTRENLHRPGLMKKLVGIDI